MKSKLFLVRSKRFDGYCVRGFGLGLSVAMLSASEFGVTLAGLMVGIIATVLVQSSSTRRGKQSLGTRVEDHACTD